jgi:hypothetical protein
MQKLFLKIEFWNYFSIEKGQKMIIQKGRDQTVKDFQISQVGIYFSKGKVRI